MQRKMRSVAGMLLTSVLTGLAGCEASAPAPDAPREVSRSMPRLTPSEITIPDSARPELRFSRLAVSTAGALAYTGAFDPAGRRVILTDGMHRERARVGLPGEGPGELRSVGQLVFLDSVLLIEDDEQARILAIASDGELLSSRRYPAGGRVLAVHADSVDVEHGFGTSRTQVRRYSLESGGWRILTGASDSAFQRITRGDSTPGRYVSPAFAAYPGGFVLANPYTYDLQYFDAEGRRMAAARRDVPSRRRTARELVDARARIERSKRQFRGPKGQTVAHGGAQDAIARLATAPLRHFSATHGLHFDGRGRLWVIGQANDSTFADVFARDEFLGRITLPCRSSNLYASLRGEWLVLPCEAAGAEVSTEIELRLYRIEEPS